ncbi:MAG TPA: hypothetical protein VHW60_18470 [Caulobacteraceae bacterium]|jgi:hypothetical protein|nr:hypothetical protein [Caulobacteraceae bacterium]
MWKLSLFLALIAGVGGFAGGWRVHDWRDASAELAASRSALTIGLSQAAISQAVAVRVQASQDRIRTVTRTLIEKVPDYVTPTTDARFPLPWSFVRLHDAAVAGADLPAPATGAGGADDAASGVAASPAAAVIVANYGACHADQDRLAAFQAWARGEGLAK